MPIRLAGNESDNSGDEGLTRVVTNRLSPQTTKGKRVHFKKTAEPVKTPTKAPTKAHSRSKTEKPKRQPSSWLLALKEYNTGKDVYHIPKKGTPEYDHVRELMEKHRK